jgi:hypothetical protein
MQINIQSKNILKQIIFLLWLILILSFAKGQVRLTPGAAQLFRNVKSRLTNAGKNSLFEQTGLIPTGIAEEFLFDTDDPEDTVSVVVLPEDLNKDGAEDVFVIEENGVLFGNAGGQLILFIKNKQGYYQANMDVPAIGAVALAEGKDGYPDLLLAVPGMQIPVWRWNGEKYTYYRSIPGENAQIIQAVDIETLSRDYISSFSGQ